MYKSILLTSLLLPALLQAAETNPPAQEEEIPAAESIAEESIIDGWSGEGQLGYTATSGNTESESLNAKLGITKERKKWKHSASIESIKTTTDNVTSADSFVFKEKSEYKFGEKAYAFGKLRYEDDEFSGYNYQASIAFGAGAQFVKTEKHTLDASAGLGYRSSEDAITGETTDEGIVTADASYEYKISKTATFTQALSVESGEENTHSESDTALKTKINGNLSSKISYLVKHNTEVPVNTEKTDTVLTVSLVYSF